MRKDTIVTTIRIDNAFRDKLDYVRKFPGGLSKFVESRLAETKIDPDKLRHLEP